MLPKKSIILLVIFLFGALVFANETIVLQNGLNEYNGCSDTHLKSLGDGDNMPFQLQDENDHENIIIETAN